MKDKTAFFVMGIGAGLLLGAGYKLVNAKVKERQKKQKQEAKVEEAEAESFPASDAPAYTAGRSTL